MKSSTVDHKENSFAFSIYVSNRRKRLDKELKAVIKLEKLAKFSLDQVTLAESEGLVEFDSQTFGFTKLLGV